MTNLELAAEIEQLAGAVERRSALLKQSPSAEDLSSETSRALAEIVQALRHIGAYISHDKGES